ncbi:hydroxyacid dehydrogenase [Roseomonas sp. NAR14]|uniref:Hydroxyacid dehydrogenase n=1 Tax=Roseomonas acroporae TaxID=2937791 RepID=A0A9X2BY97_9PROT|nr:hydroxyacid dehydrogenase [Roseomonas acroporae]MCK8785775.1 hydroxyacid dehydrogenase [Roseomonas acroporae]
MPHILMLNHFHPDAVRRLRETAGYTVETIPEVTREALLARIGEADAVLVRSTRIDRPVIEAAGRLRLLCRHGVGYDSIDVPALTERNILLTVTPDANAVSVAEHTLMLLLAAARRLAAYDANVRAGTWGPRPELPTFDLAGRTVLVVGFGRIGARVARLCLAFGMTVLVYDPYVPGNTIKGAGCLPARTLAAGLAEADAVTLHCPSNEETRGMVDRDFLAAMKPGAVLVNSARGTVVREEALAEALHGRHLAGAGVDVFWEEPVPRGSPLLDAPNLMMTPHSAASTAQGLHRMAMSCAESVLTYFAGNLDPDVVVNREVLARVNDVPGAG